MNFGTYVVLGTVHVRCTTAQRLNALAGLQPGDRPMMVACTHCGWLIGTQISADGPRLPDDLDAILAFGRRHGCDFVLLDSDGAESPELPVFPW